MKILMCIAKKGFQDYEFKIPYDTFVKAGFLVDIASTDKGTCEGKYGALVESDLSFSDVKVLNYLAVVLVGGPGSYTLVGNKDLLRIFDEAFKTDLIVGAICYSPMILAKANLIKGRQATVWNGDKKQAPFFKGAGINYVDKAVVTDNKFVTANGPDAALAYGEEILRLIECEDCHIPKIG